MNENLFKNSMTVIGNNKLLSVLLLVFVSEFVWLAISPTSREDWLLENVLLFVFLILIVFNYKKYTFSKMSWVLIFVFLFIHEIGAHYTYSEVPYDDFFNLTMGFRLNELMSWERNHFDRLAHFSYGLLLVLPFKEICSQVSGSSNNWTYFVALTIVMSTSMLFELFEWGAAWVFGGELGVAYLGTQGDVWDAQQDMLLSTIGALLALLSRFIATKLQ